MSARVEDALTEYTDRLSQRQAELTIASTGTSLIRRLATVSKLRSEDLLSRVEKNMTKNEDGTGMVEQIHLGPGFHEADRELVVSELGALDRHLDRWRTGSVDIHLSIQDRGSEEQRITLEIRLPHRPSLVVHVSDPNIERALVEARRLMIREVEEVRPGISSRAKRT
jgi:hypothetical protein